MIICPLCRENIIIFKKLCDKCEKIRHLSMIYGIDKVIEILEKILVVGKFRDPGTIQEPNMDLLNSVSDKN